MSLQRKGTTIYLLFCLQGLLYAGNNTIFESTGLYREVICVLVIYIYIYIFHTFADVYAYVCFSL
jgi:hypothetical protein